MSRYPEGGSSPEQLSRSEAYAEEELSELVEISVYEIGRAAREGRHRARGRQ
jgi:hypothetical protein